MPQYGVGMEEEHVIEVSGRNSDQNQDSNSNSARYGTAELPSVLTIVVTKAEEAVNAEGDGLSKGTAPEKEEKAGVSTSAKKGFLTRSDSDYEQCRVCQQLAEESLIDLGCGCRGELAKAHKSCIEIWFRARGSNTCEICQQVAVNVPLLHSQPTTNYWVWRVDSAYGRSNFGRRVLERGCISPLWIAFSILIGGLLLDVLISVSLGVSALPVNIIIGVLIVLGLGTALRLATECCQQWGSRSPPSADVDISLGYHPPTM